jgi:hypothetical protein
VRNENHNDPQYRAQFANRLYNKLHQLLMNRQTDDKLEESLRHIRTNPVKSKEVVARFATHMAGRSDQSNGATITGLNSDVDIVEQHVSKWTTVDSSKQSPATLHATGEAAFSPMTMMMMMEMNKKRSPGSHSPHRRAGVQRGLRFTPVPQQQQQQQLVSNFTPPPPAIPPQTQWFGQQCAQGKIPQRAVPQIPMKLKYLFHRNCIQLTHNL